MPLLHNTPLNIAEYSSKYFTLNEDQYFTDEELRIVEQDFRGKIDIIPRSGGRYEIKTQEYVGYVVLPNHIISILPKITGVSFFNMIKYALLLPNLNTEDLDLGVESNYYDILVRFLIEELEKILQRGLYTGYKNYSESLPYLRGKILFKEQVYNNHNRVDKIHCSFSELSPDIIENRIIKYTLHYLSQCYFIDETINGQLLRYYRRLDEVDLIPVSMDTFTTIEYTPLNEHYKTIINLCELFLRDSSLDQEKIGEKTAMSFLIDMNKLFEVFVSNLLIERLEGYEINPQETVNCNVEGNAFKLILDLLIKKNGVPVLILDTKYKQYIGTPDKNDIYQLFYYSSNTHIRNCCLVYPGRGMYDKKEQEQNILIHVIMLDLTARNRFEFEDKCSSFINKMFDMLNPITREDV